MGIVQSIFLFIRAFILGRAAAAIENLAVSEWGSFVFASYLRVGRTAALIVHDASLFAFDISHPFRDLAI